MNIKEQLANLLPDVEITEDFVTKLTASIETMVAKRVDEETSYIHEKAEEYASEIRLQLSAITEKANAYADYVVDEMTRKVDDYCEFIVKRFIADNHDNLVMTEEYYRMGKALHTIKEAFERNFFQLKSSPAINDYENKLSENKKEYNSLFEQHRLLKRQINEYSRYIEIENRKNIFEDLTSDLADTQKERLQRLIEKTEFPDSKTYRAGLDMMITELNMANRYSHKKLSKLKENDNASSNNSLHELLESNSKMKAYLEKL